MKINKTAVTGIIIFGLLVAYAFYYSYDQASKPQEFVYKPQECKTSETKPLTTDIFGRTGYVTFLKECHYLNQPEIIYRW